MILIDIQITDPTKVIARLTTLGKDLNNPRELYARFGVQGLKWIDDNFKAQGGLIKEGKWKKLADSTLRSRRTRKRKRTSSEKILTDSGELRKSFETSFSSKGVLIGTEKEYAIYHDSDLPRKKLPQRRMTPRQRDDSLVDKLVKTLRNYLIEKGRGLFN